ncbi:hypothetical protein WJX81_000389 [Elliptochloris bilobata]|uniref:Protein kinase domain-containing protein n=1 Tax=Elliptochloris bilobata TaxID=381761 RepID=A0AAW1RT89_9CHLO
MTSWRSALLTACVALLVAAPAAGQASLVQSCNSTAQDLFSPHYNVTEALREYNDADAAARAVVPHPGTGFTFFLPADATFGNDSVALSGAPHATVAAEAARGLAPSKRASVWLYNMLPTAQSADQLGQAGAADTVLARVVSGPGEAANASYVLHFTLPSGSLLAGKQALVGDLLGSRARILASYSVCSTWVHVVDALLWPAASTDANDVPDPAIGGVFRDPLAAVLPNASQIWSPVALAVIPQASNVALPPALVPPNPQNSPLNSVVNTVIDATQAGITAAANRLQNQDNVSVSPAGPGIAARPPTATAKPAGPAPAPAPSPAAATAAAAGAALSGQAPSRDTSVHTTNIIAAVVVPVAVLTLVAVALATACWWRRKGGGSQPGSAKARDLEAGAPDKPGERFSGGMGPFPGHAGADATIAGIVEMGRAKDSASSVAGRGADSVACLSTTNGSYTGAHGGLIGTAEHPSPPSVAGSDRPLLHGMGPLRSASYLLAARNSTDDAQYPLPDEEFFMAPLPALDTWRSASGSRLGGTGGSEDSCSDWFIRPEDVVICKDPRGNDWQLGSGAYGSVYKGMLQGSTPVAVKFVRGHSPKEQARFRNEVGILKSLRHTNIVQFLGASSNPGQIMLVTEYLPRGDLWRALSKDSQHVFSWYRRGRQIALDVVRGLHHMHSRKVMHLDLKSANILLARDGTAKIADVGLAKILTRDNTCVSTEGTFDWAAPEVLSGLECSEKADIWSLGVVLWEVVTGERPHMRQLRELRVPEECPAEVERVISVCRLVDPAARPTALDVYNSIFRSPVAPPPGVSLPAGAGLVAAPGLERSSSGAASASATLTSGNRVGSAGLASPRAPGGPPGQAAALKRGPSPPPAAPRQAVH